MSQGSIPMAFEIVQFLMEKYTDGLREEPKMEPPFKIKSHLDEIAEELKKKIKPSMIPNDTESMRGYLYDLDDLLIECRMLAKKHEERRERCMNCFSLRDLWVLFKYKNHLIKIKKKIQILEAPESRSETDPITTVVMRRWTCRHISGKIHEFVEPVAEMEKMLTEPERGGGFRAIGVVGIGGMGKTTLARTVFNSSQVKAQFYPRLWICLSQTIPKGNDVKMEITKRMLMSLAAEEETIESIVKNSSGNNYIALDGLLFALHQRLLDKPYLIVFDDVWNIDGWYEGLDSTLPMHYEWGNRLAHGLPKCSGGRVIVTSRIEGVANRMVGKQNVYKLPPLLNEEIRLILETELSNQKDGEKKNSGPTLPSSDTVNSTTERLSSGKEQLSAESIMNNKSKMNELVNMCQGLPLAAKTLGDILVVYSKEQTEPTNAEHEEGA